MAAAVEGDSTAGQLALPDPATTALSGADFVTQALVRSKAWLAQAMESTDPEPIVKVKAWAATVEEATRQLGLGQEIELDAAEIVRRAERGIGVAIRNGQAAGEIETRVEAASRAGRQRFGAAESLKPRPHDYGTKDELTTVYALTDGVDEPLFEEGLTEAKAEGNLSRANVVRKIKGTAPVTTGRPEVLRGRRRIDPNRVIEQTVLGANPNPGGVLGEVDFTALDASRMDAWITILASHIKGLRALKTQLEQEVSRRVAG